MDWFAANAFVSYLNSLSNGAGYGGSNQWALPTQLQENGYNNTNSQLGELYYNELNAKAYPATNFGILGTGTLSDTSGSTGPFINTHTNFYWTGTENFLLGPPGGAYRFNTAVGSQYTYSKTDVQDDYAWPVSPGQVGAAPVPGAVWLFGAGLLGLLGLQRRR